MKRKILEIKIIFNDTIIGHCNYLKIEKEKYISASFFYLKDFHFVKEVLFNQNDIVKIQICYINKFNVKVHLVDFGISLIDDLIQDDCFEIFGLLVPIDGITYDQRIIDIFYNWQNNEEIDWWSMDKDYKDSYLYCCGSWSGLSKDIFGKDYFIDCSLIDEKLDFYYLLGSTFFGNRGYFGNYAYTLGDCLTEIYTNSNSLKNLNIKFLHHKKAILVLGVAVFNEICTLFENSGVKILKE
jgi:hypothetical protein